MTNFPEMTQAQSEGFHMFARWMRNRQDVQVAAATMSFEEFSAWSAERMTTFVEEFAADNAAARRMAEAMG